MEIEVDDGPHKEGILYVFTYYTVLIDIVNLTAITPSELKSSVNDLHPTVVSPTPLQLG